jgi:hypothetical protein
MITALFFIIGAILATFATIGAFISYAYSDNRVLKYLALVFLFMALHAYAFSLPALFAPHNLTLIAYGYVVGILCVFVLLVLALHVQAFISLKFFKKYANLISIIIAIVGVIVVSILAYDLQLPIINSHGIIFWNANILATTITGIICFVYGGVWTYVFYMASDLARHGYSKLKLLILSADGLLSGLGGLFIYTSHNEMQSVIGMVLFMTACVITAPIFVMPKKNIKS